MKKLIFPIIIVSLILLSGCGSSNNSAKDTTGSKIDAFSCQTSGTGQSGETCKIPKQ